jgi:hypothetical protein
MPGHPFHLDFDALPSSPAVEAAARRRIRGIERACPRVLEWDVGIAMPERPAAPDVPYAATVQARIAGGGTLCKTSPGTDALAALRLAFNALEEALDAEQEQVRTRAAAWLAAVKRRMGQDNTVS